MITPAAPSVHVSGENLSAITVTRTFGSLCKMQTAVESPQTPAPTTATAAAIFVVNYSSHKSMRAHRMTHENWGPFVHYYAAGW